MDIDIIKGPGNAAASCTLSSGETCTAEGGAMISMSGEMDIQTTTHQRGGGGGLLKAAKRVLSGESFFLNHFTAGPEGGNLMLSTTLPGDMLAHDLENTGLVVQSGSFVACEESVDMDLGWQGMKSMFSGEGLFWIELSGPGQVIVNSFGGIYPINVNGTEIVDTGHIVAFEESLSFSISKAGASWVSSILGGEGLVCRFEGTGTVWAQSHHPVGFGRTLGPMLKSRNN
ncbi:MAG: TIGR00266 family protein [Planctomycetota bacterium]